MILRQLKQIVVALWLSLALMLLPTFVPNHSAPLFAFATEDARHASLAVVEHSDHGHAHEDGEPYEKRSGHAHGHDSADHSHHVAIVSHHAVDALQKLDDIRFVDLSDRVKRELGSMLERPPKPGMWTDPETASGFPTIFSQRVLQ